MTSLDLYWLTRLDYLRGFFVGVGVIFAGTSFGISLATYIMWTNYEKINWPKILKFLVPGWGLAFIFWGSFALIPTTKEMAFIIVIPKLVNAVKDNHVATQLPNKVIELANSWLEKLKVPTGDKE